MAQAQLKRRLGFGLLTLYGVGVMVGAGIYVLIGPVAGATGAWAPLAFLLAGVIAAPTALSYAELGSRIPESAGEAAYVRAATGSGLAATLAGAAVAAVGVISAAAVLQGGVGYLRGLVDLPAAVLAVPIALILTAAAVIGVLESLALAAILTVIELGGLAIVIGAGALAPVAADVAQPLAPLSPPLAGIAAASLLAFFAFIGFEDMVNMAEETHDPARTLPRAILAALALTTLLYVTVAWAASRAVPAADLAASDRPLVLVVERATGGEAASLSLIAVAAALNGVLAQIVMAARVLFGLGRFSPPFAVFHQTHPRFGTPVRATVLVGGLVIALSLGAGLVALAEATSTVLLIVFCGINAALIALKRQQPDAPFQVPVWVPWLGLVLSLGALIAGMMA